MLYCRLPVPVSFSFSHRKTTQCLNSFARRAGVELNKMKALKLLYFADRYHLRRYGRPISGDKYFAMPFGPVASGAKDLAEMDVYLSDDERSYAGQFITPVDSYSYRSIAEIDDNVLSQSDREALGWAWTSFGHLNQFELADLTHEYPEWKVHQATLDSKRASRVQMHYRDFLDDPENPMINPCHPLDAEQRALLAETIHERLEIERFLS